MNSIRKLLKMQPKYPTHRPNPQPHPALPHLKITFKVDEYLEIVQAWKNIDPPEGYLSRLPSYVIARCPLCYAEYNSLLDTHSLRSWGTIPEQDQAVFNKKYQEIGCEHFVAVHSFVNLNGIFPTEKSRYFLNHYDVPFISPLFIPDDIPASVVIHSLPICRIEDGQFVPRYGLYMLTYFAPEEYIR
jgi:hypothetical protein